MINLIINISKNLINKNHFESDFKTLNILKYLILSFLSTLQNNSIIFKDNLKFLFTISKIEKNNNSFKITILYYLINSLMDKKSKILVPLAKKNNKSSNNQYGNKKKVKNFLKNYKFFKLLKNIQFQNSKNTKKINNFISSQNISEKIFINQVLNNKKIFNLLKLLEKITNKKIQLNFVRINLPYLESNIFAK